jgi:predicted O-methyltransferase YrrM
MDEATFQPPPNAYEAILAATRKIGFQSWCWPQVGALLRVIAATKLGGRMLEIGTGTGVGTCWLLDGMDAEARLTTVDTSPKVQAIAQQHLGTDPRLTILCEDGAATIDRPQIHSISFLLMAGR